MVVTHGEGRSLVRSPVTSVSAICCMVEAGTFDVVLVLGWTVDMCFRSHLNYVKIERTSVSCVLLLVRGVC